MVPLAAQQVLIQLHLRAVVMVAWVSPVALQIQEVLEVQVAEAVQEIAVAKARVGLQLEILFQGHPQILHLQMALVIPVVMLMVAVAVKVLAVVAVLAVQLLMVVGAQMVEMEVQD
jgi:hypothetical protein